MTREQAEANWGWDPQRGSIPFRRPRITARNIRQQRELARPGTLVHWAGGRKSCSRAEARTDVTQAISGKATVVSSAIAHYVENVNCLNCRRLFFARRRA